MHASPPATSESRTSPHRPRGFTLVELLIAMVVLAVGLLALTSAGAAIVKLEGRGQQLARVAAVGEARLELLRQRPCEATSGASSSYLEERWSVTHGAARTRLLVDSIAVGGEAATPISSYTFRSAVAC